MLLPYCKASSLGVKIVIFHQLSTHLFFLYIFYRNSCPLVVALKANLPRSKGDYHQDSKCPTREDLRPIPQMCFKIAGGRGSTSAWKVRNPPVTKPESDVKWTIDYWWSYSSWEWSDFWWGCLFCPLAMDCPRIFWGLCRLKVSPGLWRFMANLGAKPKFLADKNIGILWGDTAHAGLWLHLEGSNVHIGKKFWPLLPNST